MYFADGGNPTEAILKKFLEVAESEKGALAIHCKAGLGRTGALPPPSPCNQRATTDGKCAPPPVSGPLTKEGRAAGSAMGERLICARRRIKN